MCSHSIIQLINIGFSLSHKICFEDFSTQVPYGSRIALIGSNGSGKSTLLKIILGSFTVHGGELKLPEDVILGYVPQMIQDFDDLSGGQRFHKALSQALNIQPNVLLLDEPTNHLDKCHRKSFLRMLQCFSGTVILASHDVELLQASVNTFWHIDNGKIRIFSGDYEDYIQSLADYKLSIEKEIALLKKQKINMHDMLMKEQNRAAKSKQKGEKNIKKNKWPTVVSKTKAGRSNETANKITSDLEDKKQRLVGKLAEIQYQEIIKPKFNLYANHQKNGLVVCIREASVGYVYDKPIIEKVSFSLNSGERIAIQGNNGAGKSTLVKAMLGYENIIKTGNWFYPKREEIGYLDQHYENLDSNETVFNFFQKNAPDLKDRELREHLAHFLFRKNEEVELEIKYLSGGEKVRLSLALMAINVPKILILDEITNNIDLITREHIIQVLKYYPGAMIVISHDELFLQAINIIETINIKHQ